MPVSMHSFRLFLFSSFFMGWGALTSPLQAQAGSTDEATVNLESLFIDAMQQVILGNPDKAINRFNEILAKDSRNAAAAYQLAKIYAQQEDHTKAFEWAQKATQWDQGNSYYQLLLARQYEQKEVYAAAAGIYEKMASAGELFEDDYEVWSFDLAQTGKLEDAIAVLDRLEQMVGVHESIIKQKYELYIRLNKTARAENELTKLIDAYPQEPRFRLLLASHYLQVNKKDKAMDVYQQILAIDPDNAQANLAMSQRLRADGADDQYLRSIRGVLSNPQVPLNDKIKELIPYLDKQMRQPEDGLGQALIDAGNELDQAHPGEAKIQALLGDIYLANDLSAEAIPHYLSALDLQPNVWSVWEQSLPLLLDHFQYQQVLEYAPKGMDYFPNQALLYYALAMAQIHTMQIRDARMNLQDATLMAGQTSPLQVAIRAAGALADQMSGDHAKALTAYDQLLQEVPQALSVWHEYLNLLSGDPAMQSKAQELVREMNSQHPDYLPFRENQAYLAYKMKDFTRASQIMETLLAGPAGLDAHNRELAGDIAFQLGQVDHAVQLWQQALERPTDRTAELQQKISSRQLVE